ncbi:MAG: hypothetical protein ACLP05_11295 [Candidatus Kryptoniota bacterium]
MSGRQNRFEKVPTWSVIMVEVTREFAEATARRQLTYEIVGLS